MTTVDVFTDIIDLSLLADNLVLSEDGIWFSRGHHDFKYIENDETDWESIEQKSFWYRHRNRCFLEFINHYPPTGTLFEIGAGNGSVALAIQQANYPVVAFEPTVRLSRFAKLRGVKNVACSFLGDARIKKGSLQNVGMFDLLEHIQKDSEFLHEIRSLMPIDGRLYCAVPAYQFLWSHEDAAADHVRRYVLGNLKRKLTNAGFIIEFATYYFSPLIIPIYLLRALPSMIGLRKHRTHDVTESEHYLKPGIVSRVLDYTLNVEMRLLGKGIKLPLGASCFVVARAS